MSNINLNGAKNAHFIANGYLGISASGLVATNGENLSFRAENMTGSSNFNGVTFTGCTNCMIRAYGAPGTEDESLPTLVNGATFVNAVSLDLWTEVGSSFINTTFEGTSFSGFRVGVDWVGPLPDALTAAGYSGPTSEEPRTVMTSVNFNTTSFPLDYQFAGIVMSDVDFHGAQLSTTEQALSGVSFLAGFVDITADPDYDVDINTGAHPIDFFQAELTGSRFLFSNLKGTKFHEATLAGTQWDTLICPGNTSNTDLPNDSCCTDLGGATPLVCN